MRGHLSYCLFQGRNRNEAMIHRDVTPLIVPPIKSLYLKDGVNQFEHFTDEIDTQWHESWILAGPRPKPDLTVGFLSSAFTIAENEKLTNYTSFENLTRPTDELCFPFLMCEVKCGNEALDYADRQNMHSCSVAVKALLKLEQRPISTERTSNSRACLATSLSIPSHMIKKMPASTGTMPWLKKKNGHIIAITFGITTLHTRRGTCWLSIILLAMS